MGKITKYLFIPYRAPTWGPTNWRRSGFFTYFSIWSLCC